MLVTNKGVVVVVVQTRQVRLTLLKTKELIPEASVPVPQFYVTFTTNTPFTPTC